MVPAAESITRLLNAAAAGNAAAANGLMAAIYNELRSLARARVRRGPPGVVLQPTELVHEAYLRLFGQPMPATWDNRAHFFGAAAQAMRNILVEQARRKQSLKRGGGLAPTPGVAEALAIEPPAEDVLALDEIVADLERISPRKATLVLLHCFTGLTLEETAAAMDMSLSTAEREWRFARALIRSRLEDDGR